MNRETILELLNRRPFKPFRLCLSSGEVHEIRHPEIAALGKSQVVLVDPETDRLVIAALLHVASVETLQAAS